MSTDTWVFPENTPKKLFISTPEDPRSFGQILDRIKGHFGPASSLAEFTIEITKWFHTSSCGCYNDPGNPGLYYEITKIDDAELTDDTVNYLLSDLIRE